MKPASRISATQLNCAISKVRSLSPSGERELNDEINNRQPNLFASCLAQQELGASEHAVEFLLSILRVVYQATKESNHRWTLISAEDIEHQLELLRGTAAFSTNLADPARVRFARAAYVRDHPEPLLLAYVMREFTLWLLERAEQGIECDADRFALVAGINIVNCVAYARAPSTLN